MKHVNKKVLVISLAVVLVAGGVGFALSRNNSHKDTPRPTNSVDYSGPTKEEAAAGNEQKKRNQQREAADKNTTPPSTAQIVVVDASQYSNIVEVRAYVANVYEEGGTCTVTFTQGSQKITKSAAAFKNVSTTQCATIDIDRSEFSTGGQWNYTVAYSSNNVSGSTANKTIELQ